MGAATVAVSDATFDAEVRKSPIPVVVDFWAEWCGPCRQIGPALEELATQYAGKVKIVKVNVDENPDSPAALGVRGIPALFMFKDGQVVSNKVGAAPKAALENWIKSRPGAYCNITASGKDPEFRWFRLVPADLLQEKILRQKDIGNIRGILVTKRNPAGYVHSVKIIGTRDSITVKKEHLIRRLLGIGPLRSNLFWVETKYNEKGFPEEFTIYGGGWGHGVGLCQSGSAGIAKRGLSYKEILEHYYKGTVIEGLY